MFGIIPSSCLLGFNMGLIKLIKSYKELGHKEFFRRWRVGMEETTPYEQAKVQKNFTMITLYGIGIGFGISLYFWRTAWWLAIILAGAFGNTFIGLMAINQRIRLLEKLEEEQDDNFEL